VVVAAAGATGAIIDVGDIGMAAEADAAVAGVVTGATTGGAITGAAVIGVATAAGVQERSEPLQQGHLLAPPQEVPPSKPAKWPANAPVSPFLADVMTPAAFDSTAGFVARCVSRPKRSSVVMLLAGPAASGVALGENNVALGHRNIVASSSHLVAHDPDGDEQRRTAEQPRRYRLIGSHDLIGRHDLVEVGGHLGAHRVRLIGRRNKGHQGCKRDRDRSRRLHLDVASGEGKLECLESN